MGKCVTQESTTFTEAKPSAEIYAKRLRKGTYREEPDGLHSRCSRCKEFWPADTEFFYPCKSSKDGLNAWCKACYLEWRWPNGRSATPQTH